MTHLAVWTANYLTGVRRERTALLEWNSHGDLRRMERFCVGKETGEGPYRLLETDYYAQAGARELAACMDGAYQRIIVDFGEITGDRICECARCDRKVIVGAVSEWQAEEFLEEVRSCGKRDRSWDYAVAFGSEETRREAEKTFHRRIFRIPVSVDPFAVTRADMDFFAGLLQE